MTERRYFNVSNGNAKYNEITAMWEIDFPDEFYRSANPNKCVTILGVYYWGDLVGELHPSDWVALHSPTLANGKPQELNNFITLAQYPAANWTKRYTISTREQKLIFDFRFRSESFNKGDPARELFDQFILELELYY